MSRAADALVFTGVGELERRPVTVDAPGPKEVTIRTMVSAISPGTELLLYRGELPAEIAADIGVEATADAVTYPTPYGYALVGEVTETGEAVEDVTVGQRVFAFHPHQTQCTVNADAVVPLSEDLSAAAGAMLPTVETATNFLMDGQPRIGERVVVFGAGVIGLWTTRLLAAFPVTVTVVEPIARRRRLADAMGADRTVPPEAVDDLYADRAPPGADLVYEVSGQPAALDDAIDAVGYDGRIIVGSWYGEKRHPLELGTDFHRDRISITSSQVSTVAPDHRGRWSSDRRLRVALDQLHRIDPSRLVTDRVPFTEAETAYRRLDSSPESTLQVLLTYDD